MDIVNEALKDEKLRAATGRPPNPNISVKLNALGDQLDGLLASTPKQGEQQKKTATPAQPQTRKANPQARYDELKKSGVSDADIYKKMAQEGY
jgi:hypothetical protein